MALLSIKDYVEASHREKAILAVLAWLNDSDHTFEQLDALIQLAVDVNYDGEIDEKEQIIYGRVFRYVADALAFVGGGGQAVFDFLEEESDDRGRRLARKIKDAPDFGAKSDQDLLEAFILGKDTGTLEESISWETHQSLEEIEEATRAIKFTGGKKTIVKKRIKKLPAKQLNALRKSMRKNKHKLHSSKALFKRQKSQSKRKAAGY